MPRVKRGTRGASRRNDVMKKASGYRGGRSKLMRTAMEAVDKANQYAYRHRRTKKREYRQLWNARISAAVKEQDFSYSKFISALKKSGIDLNRKMLSEMAIHHLKDFTALVEEAKKVAA